MDLPYNVKKIGDNSEESCKYLHRNMLYPFMSVYGEVGEEEERELVNLPSKSLCCNAMLLQEANLKMESHFETI